MDTLNLPKSAPGSRVLALAILVMVTSLLSWGLEAGAESYSDQHVSKDQHDEVVWLLLMFEGDVLEVKRFTITSGAPGDIYVLEESEYSNYKKNKNFSAAKAMEKVQSTSFKWTKPDSETYYLIVDNKNNTHENDAYSGKDMVYDIEYEYGADIDTSLFGGLFALLMGSLIIAVGLLFVIDLLILIWIYKDAEKRGKSGSGWLIFAFFCGPLACLIWLLVRPPMTNRPSRGPTTRPPPTAAGYAGPGATPPASAAASNQRGKSAALGLGHEAGASGMRLPRGSEATERPLFGTGGYFSSQSGPDEAEEEEDYDEEPYQPAPDLPAAAAAAAATAAAPPTEAPPPPPTQEGSMVVTVACPGCGHQFEVPSTGGPQTIACPACQLSGTMTV